MMNFNHISSLADLNSVFESIVCVLYLAASHFCDTINFFFYFVTSANTKTSLSWVPFQQTFHGRQSDDSSLQRVAIFYTEEFEKAHVSSESKRRAFCNCIQIKFRVFIHDRLKDIKGGSSTRIISTYFFFLYITTSQHDLKAYYTQSSSNSGLLFRSISSSITQLVYLSTQR